MTGKRLPRYTREILRGLADKQLPRGQVVEAHVYHDDWCAIFRGGECDCDPRIELPPLAEKN